MVLDTFEYYKMYKEKHINIIYCGPVWADGIEAVGETLKKSLVFDAMPLSLAQSVFSVFVEQMNNILMYSAERECYGNSGNKYLDAAKGIFVLGEQEKTYFLQSGNIIKNESINVIKSRIDYLNSLDKAGLHRFYKEKIKSKNSNLESKGAGLGLIEIARRSNSKIEYCFTPVNEKFAFFAICVTIGGE